MPSDDGEFYQFCYVTSTGHVRGASTPFQFKVPFVDELIEIEDENGELLVIKTKTAVLEEQLKKAHETQAQLRKVSNFIVLLSYQVLYLTFFLHNFLIPFMMFP